MEKAALTLPWPEAVSVPDTASLLESELASVTGHLELPPALMAHYAADTVPLSFVGIPKQDETYAEWLIYRRRCSLASIAGNCEWVFGESRMFTDIAKMIKRVKRHGTLALGEIGIGATPDMRAVRQSVYSGVEKIRKTRDKGLARDPTMNLLLSQLQLIYYDQVPPVWEEADLAADWADEELLEEMYGPEPPPEVEAAEVLTYLRAQCELDLSEPALNARFEHFVGATQLSLINVIAGELSDYAQTVGPRIKRAFNFAQAHNGAVMSDSLQAKQTILHELADLMHRDHAELAKGSPFKQALSALRARARATAVNIDECMFFFGNVYANNPAYAMPPLLAEWMSGPDQPEAAPEPVPVRAAAVVIRAVEPEIEIAEPELVDPEFAALVADIERQRAELHARAADLSRWTSSKSARKKQGLDVVAERLEEGYLAPYHHELERVGMVLESRVAAWGVVDAAAHLNALAGEYTADEVRRRVAADIALRGSIAVEGAKLQAYAQEQGYNGLVRLPDMPDIAGSLQRIADNWRAFSRLIKDVFPERGAELCGNVWQGLPQPNPDSTYHKVQPYRW